MQRSFPDVEECGEQLNIIIGASTLLHFYLFIFLSDLWNAVEATIESGTPAMARSRIECVIDSWESEQYADE